MALDDLIKKENEKSIYDLQNEVVKKMKVNSAFIGQVIMTVILATLTLIILGATTLFWNSWDWSIFASSEFWVNYGVVQLASWFARIWIMLVCFANFKDPQRLAKLEFKGEICLLANDYFNYKKRIQAFVDLDFEKHYIYEMALADDRKRKINAWIKKQKLRLLKIQKRYKLENLNDYLNTLNFSDFKEFEAFSKVEYIFRKKERVLAKISTKINAIVKTLDPKYIDTNFENLKVKWNKVSKIILTNGFGVSHKGDEGGADYKKHTSSEFSKATLPIFIVITVFLAIIIPIQGHFNNELSAWIQFFTNLFVVSIAGFTMIKNSNTIFANTELKSLKERENTLNTYAKESGVKNEK